LKKIIKLTQNKLYCLLLIETSFEVKTQFECCVTYKSNDIIHNFEVSSDSEKVMMHFPTEAYMSHTCHGESPRDVHPYVGRVVQGA
jgi:hypothetical protein